MQERLAKIRVCCKDYSYEVYFFCKKEFSFAKKYYFFAKKKLRKEHFKNPAKKIKKNNFSRGKMTKHRARSAQKRILGCFSRKNRKIVKI